MAILNENNRTQTLEAITTALHTFTGGAGLYGSTVDLLNTLGYKSEKTQTLPAPTFEGFKEAFAIGNDVLNETKAKPEEWKRIDFVFQLGNTEISGINSLFATGKMDPNEYQSFLFVSIELKEEEYKRADLVAITRELNKPFLMPVIVLFYYSGKLTLSVIDRRLSKRDSSKDVLEKVTLIKDINGVQPHRAHLEILADLNLANLNRTQHITSFLELHEAWKKTLSISELNKRFYRELSNWYFWASKEVIFPGTPTLKDAHEKGVELEDLIQEHRATNVIRLLTRLLFVWFIKEKGLIPEELFELKTLQKDILKEISPNHTAGLFTESNKESVYYKAILQNLFFATLNCPIEGDSMDKRKRGFRGEGYGTHRGIDYLMRYRQYFKNPEKFLEMMNAKVPFLNGGLFECLDDKFNNKYIDGFSDQMTQGNRLMVPDYIFFGVEEKVDLSKEYGVSNAGTKQAAVKGLINILKSYKFTITENTPIEEEVALDPELLGKVFENLLASYNPETKTTARKQTGSFYTPREIVDYMVNESLIAFLKTSVKDWGGLSEETIEIELRALTSFDQSKPFGEDKTVQRAIIEALSDCKILDPACGSGAFPMGILQKMVQVLQKLDGDNKIWREVQLDLAKKNSEAAFDIDDKGTRTQRLLEVNEAFDQGINDPDYARKLFLIENCIYGVDIQPIATQISKLRFFISLVVEQKVALEKDNFGIRPLPNLETKFVAANTLVDIEKPKAQTTLYDTPRIKELERELKAIRSRLFNARTKDTKLKYRNKDLELRTAIAEELKKSNWTNDAADKLAGWDPYDQNIASPFFNPEWMFDVTNGFDIVIGNPPYLRIQGLRETNADLADQLVKLYKSATGSFDLYVAFTERALQLIKSDGVANYIMPIKWTNAAFGKGLREVIAEKSSANKIISFGAYQVFNASTYTGLQWFKHNSASLEYYELDKDLLSNEDLNRYLQSLEKADGLAIPTEELSSEKWVLSTGKTSEILQKLNLHPRRLSDVFEKVFTGLQTSLDSVYFLHDCTDEEGFINGFSKEINEFIKIEIGFTKPLLKGSDVHRYDNIKTNRVVIFPYKLDEGNAKLYTEKEIAQSFPHAYNYLKRCEKVLRGREKGRLKNDAFWYKYIYPKNLTLFQEEKIVGPEISLGGNYAYDENGQFYSTTTVYGYVRSHNANESYYTLLAILNSKLFWWYLKNTGTVLANGFFRYKPDYIKPFPMPAPISADLQHSIDQLVTEIHHSANEKQNEIMKSIDSIIYSLYNLDSEEVKCIEDAQTV